MFRPAGLLLALLAVAASPFAASAESLDVQVRGKTLSLTIYRPAIPPKGTIIMGSGDVGWVGLAVSLADELRRGRLHRGRASTSVSISPRSPDGQVASQPKPTCPRITAPFATSAGAQICCPSR